jgi:hypothetical protein
MPSWLTCRLAGALLGLALATLPAAADDLADFNAAVEKAAAHNRVALGYLRTDSVDLATLELERMQDAWGDLLSRFGQNPPAAFRDNQLFAEVLVDVPTRVVGTMLQLQMGRPDAARASLQGIRERLSEMRQRSHVVVLADCVLDANSAMAAFFKYDESPPNWRSARSVTDFKAAATALALVIHRCDRTATEAIRKDPEFRRLIDGTIASLAFVPKAIDTHDSDLVHRLVGELRAFDNLLVFRYG